VAAPPGVRTAERIAAAAEELGADVWEADGPEAALAGLPGLLDDEVRRAGGRADVLLLVDSGAAMFETVRALARAPELFGGALALGARVAVGSYRGYADSFFLRVHPFATAPEDVARDLGSLKAWGGRARRPMWSALSEALHGLVWGAGRTPVVVIVTCAAPTDEPGARAGARAWLVKRGARVQLVRVATTVRVAPMPAPGLAVGVAFGAAGRPLAGTPAAPFLSFYGSVRTFRSLRVALDYERAGDARVAVRAGWEWPFLGFTIGGSLRFERGGGESAAAHLGPPIAPSATLRLGPLRGLSLRAALFAADTDAAPGLPLVRGGLVWENARFRLGVGLGALPPGGPAVTYAFAVAVFNRYGRTDLGLDAFAGLARGAGALPDELAYGFAATVAWRSWRFPRFR
jgi:hypothetical protein